MRDWRESEARGREGEVLGWGGDGGGVVVLSDAPLIRQTRDYLP